MPRQPRRADRDGAPRNRCPCNAVSATEVGERVEKILSDNGVGFLGSTTVTDDRGPGVLPRQRRRGRRRPRRLRDRRASRHQARRQRPASTPTTAASSSTSTCTPRRCNVYAAGDVALAYNVTAGRRIRAEHWRDAAQQGLVAGLTAAGYPAAWDQVPGFSCTIGESVLKYRGWGIGYEHSRLVDHHDGFTVCYESDGEVVGVLTLNADDDHLRAEELLRRGSPKRRDYAVTKIGRNSSYSVVQYTVRRLNIQYNPSTISTMIDVLVTKPPTVSMPGYFTF